MSAVGVVIFWDFNKNIIDNPRTLSLAMFFVTMAQNLLPARTSYYAVKLSISTHNKIILLKFLKNYLKTLGSYVHRKRNGCQVVKIPVGEDTTILTCVQDFWMFLPTSNISDCWLWLLETYIFKVCLIKFNPPLISLKHRFLSYHIKNTTLVRPAATCRYMIPLVNHH